MKLKRLLPIVSVASVAGMTSCLVACKTNFGPVEPLPIPDPETIALDQVTEWPYGGLTLPAVKTSQKYNMLSNKTFNFSIDIKTLLGKIGSNGHFTFIISNVGADDMGNVDIKTCQFFADETELFPTIAYFHNIDFQHELAAQIRDADTLTGSVTIDNYGKSTPPTGCEFVFYWSEYGL